MAVSLRNWRTFRINLKYYNSWRGLKHSNPKLFKLWLMPARLLCSLEKEQFLATRKFYFSVPPQVFSDKLYVMFFFLMFSFIWLWKPCSVLRNACGGSGELINFILWHLWQCSHVESWLKQTALRPQLSGGMCCSVFLAGSWAVCSEKCVIAVWYNTRGKKQTLDKYLYR